MSHFLADWRNPVLVFAIIGTILFGSLWMSGSQPNTTVISVGDTTFSEKDIVNALKARVGKQVVTKIVNQALLDNYGRKKGISVTESDVDQLVRFNKNQIELSGQDYDEVLKAQGLSLETFTADLKTEALRVKLLVTPEEMKSQVDALSKSRKAPFTLPARYRISLLTFASKKDADTAFQLINTGDPADLTNAMAMIVNGSQAQREFMYAKGQKESDPAIDNALTNVRAGSCSKPFTMKAMHGMYSIVRVFESFPAEKPTYENSNIIAGLYLLQTQTEKYAPKMRDLEAAALDEVDIQFFSDDYDAIRQSFKERKVQNPNIPLVDQLQQSTTPAPANPASGK